MSDATGSVSPEYFPPPRVPPHAGHALGGIWRLTARRFSTLNYWLVLAGMLAALVVLSLPAASNRPAAARDFLSWAGGFYVCFVVPVLSFILGGGAMRDDLGAAAVDYVFTRPVRRPLYVLFKYIAHVAAVQIDFLFALMVVAGIGMFWRVPGLWDAVPYVVLGQVVAVFVFTAAGFFCAQITSRYVIVGLVYSAVVEVGLGNVPTQVNQISLLRHMVALVRPVLGDRGWSLTPGALAGTVSVPATLAVLFGVAAAGLVVCAIIFSRREFAGEGARET